MALTKPILNSVSSWDVSNGQTFTFNVIGGDQVVGNILYIVNNLTNDIVYTLETSTYQYKAIVPPNALGLENGKYYSAYIVTKNSLSETSVASNIIQFYCYTTPSWVFDNIYSGIIINNSSVVPVVNYNQSQGEALNDYTFNLYNTGKVLIATSGMKYTGSSQSTQVVSYSFFGLEDGTSYYLEAVGHTTGGTLLTTGLVEFSVSYIAPESFNVLLLQNNCNDGYITYYSLAYVNEGDSYPSPPHYVTIFSPEEMHIGVDLTNEDYWVKYDSSNSNFIIPQNFTIKAWIFSPNVNSNLITLSNGLNDSIKLWYGYLPYEYDKVCVSLIVNENEYFIYSNSIELPQSTDELYIQIKKIGNFYDLTLGVV